MDHSYISTLFHSITQTATTLMRLTPSSKYPPTLLSTTHDFSTASTSMDDVREIIEYVGNQDFYSMENPVTIVNSAEVFTVPPSDSNELFKEIDGYDDEYQGLQPDDYENSDDVEYDIEDKFVYHNEEIDLTNTEVRK